VGSNHSAGTIRIREFLSRNGHPHKYINLDEDSGFQEFLDRLHVTVADVPVLARLFGLPSFPLTATFPLLGPVGVMPLPSKWFIAFGEPVDTVALGPEAAEDPALVLEISEEVRGWIQAAVDRMLPRRKTVFY